MIKERAIYIRVTERFKQRVQAAAEKKGQTMSTFVLGAVDKAVARVEAEPAKENVPRGELFQSMRSFCREGKGAGGSGYGAAGYLLASNVATLAPIKSIATVGEMYELAENRQDDEKLLALFDEQFPQFMQKHVPTRRRGKFLEGAIAGLNRTRILAPRRTGRQKN